MAVSFSFVKTQCNSSLFDILRHGQKEVVHSERKTMQTTMFNTPYPTAQGTTNKYGPVLLHSSSKLTQGYREKEAEITIRHNDQKLFLWHSRHPMNAGIAFYVLRKALNIKLKLLKVQSVAWNQTIVGTLVVRIYRSWLYSTYHPVKRHSHYCRECSLPSRHTAKKYKRSQNTIAVRITAVKAAYLTTLNRNKHLAIINPLFADNRDIKPSHLPITFLGMCILASDS